MIEKVSGKGLREKAREYTLAGMDRARGWMKPGKKEVAAWLRGLTTREIMGGVPGIGPHTVRRWRRSQRIGNVRQMLGVLRLWNARPNGLPLPAGPLVAFTIHGSINPARVVRGPQATVFPPLPGSTRVHVHFWDSAPVENGER